MDTLLIVFMTIISVMLIGVGAFFLLAGLGHDREYGSKEV